MNDAFDFRSSPTETGSGRRGKRPRRQESGAAGWMLSILGWLIGLGLGLLVFALLGR
jgi:hypothetical protein